MEQPRAARDTLAAAMPETLRFDDLAPYLLLRNGNYLYKVPFRGGFAVVKVYTGSRSRLQTLVKSFENVVFAGQTPYFPATRRRIERECLALWRRHGFRVYDTYDDIEVVAPQCPPGSYTVFEYKSGPKLFEVLRDESLPVDRRLGVYRRFLAEWGRRHELAVALREPRLVHENGDGKHVLVFDDELLWFDFEMIWRNAKRVPDQVSHEIVQYLWFLSKSVPDLAGRLLEETAAGYPKTDRLRAACAYFLDGPRRALDRNLRARAKRPTSKYAVARRLRAVLDAP
jgi:hypothetical protein